MAVVAGWTRVEDVRAYQLSVTLRDRITALSRRPAIAGDFRFRDQLVDAAASAARNISEGFARYQHAQFAYFVRVAKASLAELQTHLIDARSRGYIADDELDALLALTSEAKATTTGLLRHLETSEAPIGWSNHRIKD